MKIYFARPKNLYGTEQDERDFATISSLGFEIVDPNNPELRQKYKDVGMDAYLSCVESCNALCFRATPFGKITAGVFKEIQKAIELGIPVFELPSILESRAMSVNDTRSYLGLIGNR